MLVAEEEDALRAEVVDALQRDGRRVVELEDGLELTDYLSLAYAPVERLRRPVVIISDIELTGVGGAEVCSRLHAQHLTPGFILLAPPHDPDAEQAAQKVGADFVFPRPIDVGALRLAVSRLIARASPGRLSLRLPAPWPSGEQSALDPSAA